MKNHMDLTVSEFAAMFRGTENVRQIIQEFQEKAEAQ